MYKDDDLLKVRAKHYGFDARLSMHKVFSTQELTASILTPRGSQYSRPPLDVEKFGYVHRIIDKAVL